MIGNFFKQRAHYVFNYTPRFYNERKERLDAIKKKYEVADQNTELKTAVKFRESWQKAKIAPSTSATLRISIIICILVLVVYLYFKYIGISFF